MILDLLIELRQQNKLMYISAYILFYLLYLAYEIPAPHKPSWQFYFPVKFMLLMISMVTAYLLNYVYFRLKHRKTSIYNLIVFVGGCFFLLVMLPSFIVQLLLNVWNVDLWFLIAT